jgi:hypothetical protein
MKLGFAIVSFFMSAKTKEKIKLAKVVEDLK